MEPKIEYVPLGELANWPSNPKKHNIQEIRASIERFGFVAPVVQDEKTKRIVAGHGRVETLNLIRLDGGEPPARVKVSKKGEWLVPVLRGIEFADEREAEAYLLADNRLVELGGWDTDALVGMLQSVQEWGGTGYEQTDLAALLLMQNGPKEAVMGQRPDEMLNTFLSSEIKQIVLYLQGEAYERVVTQLADARAKLGVESNSDVIVHLLEKFSAA